MTKNKLTTEEFYKIVRIAKGSIVASVSDILEPLREKFGIATSGELNVDFQQLSVENCIGCYKRFVLDVKRCENYTPDIHEFEKAKSEFEEEVQNAIEKAAERFRERTKVKPYGDIWFVSSDKTDEQGKTVPIIRCNVYIRNECFD